MDGVDGEDGMEGEVDDEDWEQAKRTKLKALWDNAVSNGDADYLSQNDFVVVMEEYYMCTNRYSPKIHRLAEYAEIEALELIFSTYTKDEKREKTNEISFLSYSHKFSPFHLACRGPTPAHAQCVKLFIKSGAEMNTYPWQGLTHGHNLYLTPLHLAVETGHVDSIRYLLEAGANPNLKSYDNVSGLDDMIPEEMLKERTNNQEQIHAIFKEHVMSLKHKMIYKLMESNNEAEISKLPEELSELLAQLKYEVPL